MADYTETSSTDDAELKPFLRRYKRAKERRALNDSIIDECYEYCLPLRERPYSSKDDGKPDLDRLYDSTAPLALQDLASQMLDDIWPTDSRPFELTAGNDVPVGDRDELNRRLSEVTEDIITTVNSSNFRNEAHEALMDWAIGTGCLLADEGDSSEPVRFRASPLSDNYFDTGPYGDIDCLFRPKKVKAASLPVVFPNGKFSEEIQRCIKESPDKDIEVVEGAMRDWNQKGSEVWISCAFLAKAEGNGGQKIQHSTAKGEGSKPFIDHSFTRVPGEVIGRGPAMTALPDVKTVNLVKQFVLENADLAISGIWQAEDDGILNLDTVRIEPRTIIPKAPGSGGITRLDMGTSGFDVSSLVVSELQQQINKIFFANDLGPTDKTPMSATEVLERASIRARRFAGPYNRVLTELFVPTIKRVAYIRQKQGAIKLPKIDGKFVKVRPLAPITRAQAQDDILRHVRLAEVLNQTVGPQQAAITINAEEFSRYLARKFSADPNVIRSKIESKQIQQAIAAMQALAAAQGNPPTA